MHLNIILLLNKSPTNDHFKHSQFLLPVTSFRACTEAEQRITLPSPA